MNKQVEPFVEAPINGNPSSSRSARKPSPKKGRGGLFLLLLFLTLLLGLAGFGYYQQYLAVVAQQNQISELQKTMRGLDNHPTLVELKQRILEHGTKFESALAAQAEQIKAVQQAFTVTQNLNNRDQNAWILAEVEYLMRLAIVRLRLVHDIKGSAEALITADERLGDLADPAMLEVRNILTDEITALKTIDVPDIEGATLKLFGISNRLHLLPPAKRPASDKLQDTSLDTEQPSEQSNSFLKNGWNKLSRLAGFHRSNAPVITAVLQAELFYVEQLLRLELEYARQAALRLDKESLDRHLATIRTMLEEHYDRDNQQVITLRAEVAALQEQQLIPALPDITGSLRKLRDLQQKYRPQTPSVAKTEL